MASRRKSRIFVGLVCRRQSALRFLSFLVAKRLTVHSATVKRLQTYTSLTAFPRLSANPNPPHAALLQPPTPSSFGLRHSFVIRISSFVILPMRLSLQTDYALRTLMFLASRKKNE